MPIIPLLKSRPLPDLPAPVLDRERRPTVDNRGVAAAIGELADANRQPFLPDSLTAPFEGLARLGNAVSRVGSDVADVATDAASRAAFIREKSATRKSNTTGNNATATQPPQPPGPYDIDGSVARAVVLTGSVRGALQLKRTQALTATQLMSAEDAMTAHDSSFRDFLAAQPDESQWESTGTAQRNAIRERILADKSLIPAAREAILQKWARWDQRSAILTSTAVAKRTFQRAAEGYDSRAEQAINSQDKSLLLSTFAAGKDLGVYTDDDLTRFDERFQQTGEKLRLNAAVAAEREGYEFTISLAKADPRHWREQNPEPWKGREDLWRRVDDAAALSQRIGAAGAIEEMHRAIVDGTVSVPGEIDAWENPSLTPRLRERFKEDLAQRTAASADDRRENGHRNFINVLTRSSRYLHSNDPDSEELHQLHREADVRVGGDDAAYLQALLRTRVQGGDLAAPPGKESLYYVNERIRQQLDPRRESATQEPREQWTEDGSLPTARIQDLVRLKEGLSLWHRFVPEKDRTVANVDAQIAAFQPSAQTQVPSSLQTTTSPSNPPVSTSVPDARVDARVQMRANPSLAPLARRLDEIDSNLPSVETLIAQYTKEKGNQGIAQALADPDLLKQLIRVEKERDHRYRKAQDEHSVFNRAAIMEELSEFTEKTAPSSNPFHFTDPDAANAVRYIRGRLKSDGWTDAGIDTSLRDLNTLKGFNKYLDPVRLSDGTILVNPELSFDEDKWAEAVRMTPGASDEEKAAAISRRLEVREQTAIRIYSALSKGTPYFDADSKFTRFERDYLADYPDARTSDIVNAYRHTHGGFLRKFWEQFTRGTGQGVASLAKQIYGVGAAATGSESLLDIARGAGSVEAEQGVYRDAIGGPAIVGDLSAGAVSLAPAMLAGGAGGLLARALALPFSAAGAAAQSFGGTFVDAYSAYRDKGMDAASARLQALPPAAMSGLITGVLTYIGGGGTEAVFAAGTRQVLSRKALKDLGERQIRDTLRDLYRGASDEFLEEATDQFLQGISAQATFDKDRSPEQVIGDAIESGKLGAILGAGLANLANAERDHQILDQSRSPALAPGQIDSSHLRLGNEMQDNAATPPQTSSLGDTTDPSLTDAVAQNNRMSKEDIDAEILKGRTATETRPSEGRTLHNQSADPRLFPELLNSKYEAPQALQQEFRKMVFEMEDQFTVLGTQIEEVTSEEAIKRGWKTGKWLRVSSVYNEKQGLITGVKLEFAPSRIPGEYNRRIFEAALDEELIHAAEFNLLRIDHFSDSLQNNGTVTPLTKFEVDRIAPILMELKATHEGRLLLTASVNAYWAGVGIDQKYQNWAEAEKGLAGVPSPNIVSELVRQIVQIRRKQGGKGEISESAIHRTLYKIQQWMSDILQRLTQVARDPKKVSPRLGAAVERVRERLKNMEISVNALRSERAGRASDQPK